MSKEKNDLFVVIILSIIWIVRPICYDEMRSRHPIYPQENVAIVNSSCISNQSDVKVTLAKNTSGNFFAEGFSPAMPRRPTGGSNSGQGQSRSTAASGVRRPNPFRHLGANPGGAGNNGGVGDPEFPVPKKQQSQESESFTYNDYRSKKKKESAEQCELDEQNKGGIDELPNSSEFFYKLETKTARKALKKVWKNPEAKKEVLAGLDRMNKGELLPRNQKNFKGFKTLKEIKLTDTRMLVQPGQNGGPDQIVAIFMRRDLDNIASIFKGKYK